MTTTDTPTHESALQMLEAGTRLTLEAAAGLPPELDSIDTIQAGIVATKAQLDGLYEIRADLFLRVSEAHPDTKVKAMADRAGVTGPAVSQQIDKAIARRHDAQVAADRAAAAEPGSEPA